MAEDAEVSTEIHDALTSGQVIPFYPDDGFNIPDQEWSNDCLVPATSLEYENKKILYSVVDSPMNSKNLIDVKRIQSFNSCCE
jgi:hypothetical protein